MEDDGWDLQAVVRGCCGTTAATATADPFSSVPPLLLQEEWGEQDDLLFCFPDLFGAQAGFQELEELWKPFFPESPRPQSQQQQMQQLQFSPQGSSSCSAAPQLPRGGGGTAQLAVADPTPQRVQQPLKQRTPPHTPRLKKRKNQQKRVVCQVPADGVSSDVWAWRKYGQKPIKGSPYPRGYYRCSSCKGCLARKQVERSRAEPGTFVVTYTGEHSHPPPTHRNSLAGSTRQKFPSSTSTASSPTADSAQEVNAPGGGAATAGGPPEQPDCKASPSSPLSSPSAGGLSPTTPLTDSMEEELHLPRERGRLGADGAEVDGEEEGGLLLVGDMELLGEDDMLFLDLDELREPNAAASFAFSTDAFSDQFGAFPMPWTANNTAAAAGGS